MLKLTRIEGETLTIGENITVRVVWIRGKVVQLGIEAPKDIPIKRDDMVKELRRKTKK